MAEGMTLAEQGKIAQEFLEGLLASMTIAATVTVRELDEETVELAVDATPPTELGVTRLNSAPIIVRANVSRNPKDIFWARSNRLQRHASRDIWT